SKKVYVKAEISSDIERPLLRPVKSEKDDAVTNDQGTVESSSNSKTEQCIENIMSILQAERKKLQELENEYKKLRKDVMEEDDAKNSEIDVKMETESISASAGNVRSSDRLQPNEKSAIAGASSALAKIYPLKDASTRNGSSTGQLYIVKDSKKPEVGVSNDLNQRLSKVIGNVSKLDLAECFYKLCEYDNALQTYKLLTLNDIPLDQYIWAQYQIANCYRNMKKFDVAFNEYQRFINQYPGSDWVEQAKWYIEDINWWKSWYEKNTLTSNQLLVSSGSYESK
ncbi:MAG: tetratricopeptide repeat protein, partial [Candidatus Brocadia sp.]